jgi:phage terminase large subunit
MPHVTIPANGWRPRPYQMKAWAAWERGIKRSLLVWHRRAGKDEVALNKFACAAHIRPANYWHCLPQYEQARKAIWEALNPHTGKRRIDEAFPQIIRKRTDSQGMTIEFLTGSIYRVVGSDNPDSLVGAPPLGIVFSEWALSNPSAWGYLQPILLENGGWADFITTPRGRNHVHGMLKMAKANPAWFAEVLTVDDTHQVTAEQIAEAKAEYVSLFGEDAAEALIQQEYWCSFEAAILGAYYGREMTALEGRGGITNVDPWPGVKLHTAWDLGASRESDSMTIWFFQIVPTELGRAAVRCCNYTTGSGYGIKWYADIIKKFIKDWDLPKGTDWVPHDARVPEMTSSGKDGKAKLRIEVMIEEGLNPKIVTNHHVADGVSAVRQLMPRVYFDETRCDTGIECLRQYQREWDDEKKVFKPTALKNWAAHGADAFRYLAMAFKEIRVEPVPERGRMLTIGDPNTLPEGVQGVRFDDLWKKKAGGRRRI